MVCQKCGKALPRDALFCTNCGAAFVLEAQNGTAPQNQTATPPPPPFAAPTSEPPTFAPPPEFTPPAFTTPAFTTPAFTTPAKKKSAKKGVKIAIFASVAAIVAVTALLLVLFLPKPIVVNDYLTVEFSGMDTKGSAMVVCDEDAFLAALKDNYPEGIDGAILFSYGI